MKNPLHFYRKVNLNTYLQKKQFPTKGKWQSTKIANDFQTIPSQSETVGQDPVNP